MLKLLLITISLFLWSCSEGSFVGSHKSSPAGGTAAGGPGAATGGDAFNPGANGNGGDFNGVNGIDGGSDLIDGGINNDDLDRVEGLFSDSLKSCSGTKSGFGGYLYKITPNIKQMPLLHTLTPIGQLTTPSINVPARRWTSGFPGHPELIEWFGVRFFGAINVKEEGSYTFKTKSDDGVRLYIDNQLIINSPGLYDVSERFSQPIRLTAGKHRFALDWWQGTRYGLAIMVYWSVNGSPYEIIPNHVVQYEEACDIENLGTLPL